MNEESRAEREPEDHGQIVTRPGWRISWAWLFPVLAAAATAWLFWTNWKSNGPEIEVVFESAPGIQAGKTPLLYRGVVAGTVTHARLDATLDKVVLTVRLKEFAAALASEGTVFWIDQPVVGLGETSGLDALIQGNSLQARLGGGAPTTHFEGRDRVPVTPLESPALILKLRASNIPFLDRGSPVFYRGVQVGVIEDKALDASGNPFLRALIEKEFAATVRNNARFWPVPATSIRVGPGGVKLDMLGLKAILLGGVEFDIFGVPGAEVPDETEFTLYPDASIARATGEPVHITFRDGQGLVAGQTEVRHLGVVVGTLESARLDTASATVDAVVRFHPDFEKLHPAGTTFTLIRPRISLEGVSGLETLIGGPYIDCEPGPAGEIATTFAGHTISDDGLDTAESEKSGVHITLRAKTLPNLAPGAPVLYRGLLAGTVKAKSIDAKGEPVLDVVIRRNFAPALARNARFWSVPPAAAQAGPGVLKIDVASLQTLLQGGLAFDVFGSPEPVAENGATFDLFASEKFARAISPAIQITFENGQGLLAGETQARYLGVPVGIVEAVRARDGKVQATVRFEAGYDFLRREGSDFSIVRLDVSLNGVSGVETVVSGVYIECVPAPGGRLAESFSAVTPAKAEFQEEAESDFEVTVTTARTNIAVNAPVTYRGIEVGKVARKSLSPDARKVSLAVMINPLYASLIRTNTKFWDAGGIRASLGFFAIKVQTASLDALARGGIAFATPNAPNMGATVEPGHEFELNATPRREWLEWAPALPSR